MAVYQQALQDAGAASGLQALKQAGGAEGDALPDALGAAAPDTAPATVGLDLGTGGEGVAADSSATAGEYLDRMAAYYAKSRAAELVGMRYDDAGMLVPNPDAAMTITDSTRNFLAQDIQDAVNQGMSVDDLTTLLQANYAFSAARANVIAEYEMARMHVGATLQGWKASGQVQGKVSKVSPAHDEYDDCDVNEAAGEIPLEAAFPTGDYGPPYHINCHCNIFAVRIDTTNQDTGGQL